MQCLRLLLPAGSWTLRPAATEPVKLIWAMSMWEAGSAPVSTPPETKLMTPGGNQPRRLVDRVQVRTKGIFRRPRRDTLFILLGLELGMSLKVVYCVSSSKRGSQLQTHVQKGGLERSQECADTQRLISHDLVNAVFWWIRLSSNLVCMACIIFVTPIAMVPNYEKRVRMIFQSGLLIGANTSLSDDH